MRWIAEWSLWSVLQRRRRKSAAGGDPADMGTAFGLDASLIDAGPGDEADPAHRDGAESGSWERRLVRRHGA